MLKPEFVFNCAECLDDDILCRRLVSLFDGFNFVRRFGDFLYFYYNDVDVGIPDVDFSSVDFIYMGDCDTRTGVYCYYDNYIGCSELSSEQLIPVVLDLCRRRYA